MDGLNTGAAFNGGGVSGYVADIGNAQEIAMTTSGGLGEAEVGGPSINIVPKTGGNTVKGTLLRLGRHRAGWSATTTPTTLKAAGLTTPGTLLKLWDYNGGVGGPIKKDRLVLRAASATKAAIARCPGMFANANTGDPTQVDLRGRHDAAGGAARAAGATARRA